MSNPGIPGEQSNDAYFGLSSKAALIVAILAIFFVLITGSVAGTSDTLQDYLSADLQYVFQLTSIILLVLIGSTLVLYCLFVLILCKIRNRHREKKSVNSIILKIKVPKENEILADAAEAIFNGLYSVHDGLTWWIRFKRYFTGQEQFSLEIVTQEGQISFYAYVTEKLASLLERQIYSQYPDAEIQKVEDYDFFFPDCKAQFKELIQTKEYVHPIKSYRDLAKEAGTQQLKEITIDSLSPLTNAMTKLEESEGAAVQILIRPTGGKWRKKGKKLIANIHDKTKSSDKKPGEQLTSGEQESIRAMENTLSKPGFECVIRIITVAYSEAKADLNLGNIMAAFEQFNTVEHNSFGIKRRVRKVAFFRNFVFRYFPLISYKPSPWLFFINPFLERLSGRAMILNTEELASIYHLPNKV
ncbi:MAG TPA: hypothetical protein ENN77_02245, partial [Candidatus Wirthbacteria bacterium]|nr:hypothetical protein [Candidatus Wirthbacteria bacterium]